jgi:hypothetical protein
MVKPTLAAEAAGLEIMYRLPVLVVLADQA